MSPCAFSSINSTIRSLGVCFVSRGSSKNFVKDSPSNLWFPASSGEYSPTDQCTQNSDILPSSSSNYVMCPYLPIGTTNCILACQSQKNSSQCLSFKNSTTLSSLSLNDGTLCGVSQASAYSVGGPPNLVNQDYVCLNGACVIDNRQIVCDR
ncbi:hypothetical protein HK096_003125 [Nowakowskiella sp. JEL0078]|nr:hypothetical protein HK096_003125 [Nowakowskiella sp. JEL0078]